jgi:hypothetical protein
MTRDHVAAALAGAFLAGEWDTAPMTSRGQRALGQRRVWVRDVALTVLHAYPSAPRDRPRELAAFIQACPSFNPAATVKRWFVAPTAMAAPRPPWPVAPLDTVGDLQELLGLTAGHLFWLADPKQLERTVTDDRLRHYRYRWFPKRNGGCRLIEEPKPLLKQAQRLILREILEAIPVHAAVHGFRRGRSAVTYAAAHTRRRVVVHLDLADFFASITVGRVYGIFRSCGYPEPVAHLLAALTTNSVPRSIAKATDRFGQPHLPQGAPTSPALANLAAFRMDRGLAALRFNYTRYADDLAFSSAAAHVDTARLVARVTRIAADEGFRVNEAKTTVQRASQRQRLAGVVVNERLNVDWRDYDRLKAILHNAARQGPASQNREAVPDFRAHLEGRIAWVRHLNPEHGDRLLATFGQIDWGQAV